MSREHRFNSSNKFGKMGEEEVLGFLEKILPNLKSIENVTMIKEYQDKDIDAILHFKNGENYTIEIKTDSYAHTGNIAYEVWSSVEDQIPGCMDKTCCDYLYYYFPDSGELYQLKMDSYREWVEKNASLNNFREVYVKNISWGKEYNSLNYLIPKVMIKACFKDYICYDMKQL